MTKIEFDTDTEKFTVTKNSFSETLGGLFFVAFLLLLLGFCSDNEQDKIEKVEKYCSSEQISKTGKKACLDAKIILLREYQNALSNNQKSLPDNQKKRGKLLETKNSKCSAQGLDDYGTEGCKTATNDLISVEKKIDANIQAINEYKQKIKDLDIPNSYFVDTNILNLRSCKGTDCNVLGKLSSGDTVYVEEYLGEWVKVLTNSGSGYVMKKFLKPINTNITTQSNTIQQNTPDSTSQDIEETIGGAKSKNVDQIFENTIFNQINYETSNVNPSTIKDVDFRNVNWNTASYQVITEMLDSGANINQKYEFGTTVLMLAIDSDANPDAVKALIEKGVDVNAKNDNGSTALHLAASKNNPEIIDVLILKGANADVFDFAGISPLMLASKDNNNPLIVEKLIKSGADVNAKSMGGMSAIDYAAYNNRNPKILEILIQNGAEFDEDILNWSQENQNPDISMILKKHLRQM